MLCFECHKEMKRSKEQDNKYICPSCGNIDYEAIPSSMGYSDGLL